MRSLGPRHRRRVLSPVAGLSALCLYEGAYEITSTAAVTAIRALARRRAAPPGDPEREDDASGLASPPARNVRERERVIKWHLNRRPKTSETQRGLTLAGEGLSLSLSPPCPFKIST